MEIKAVTNLLQANETIASENKALFTKYKVFVLNLMSSPGAGKTSLLEVTIEHFKNRFRIGVIEGDISGQFDAKRLARFEIPIVQINTDRWGGDCHLDANMIRNALPSIDLSQVDLLFIENVGNLVCPAEFNVGENAKIVISSIPEGDDKPLKYPLIFRVSKLLLLNKIDLIPYTNFNKENFVKAVNNINPKLKILEISVKEKKGLEQWFDWLENELAICHRKK
jgi:hydrogenase nickel incorporation protein HypB